MKAVPAGTVTAGVVNAMPEAVMVTLAAAPPEGAAEPAGPDGAAEPAAEPDGAAAEGSVLGTGVADGAGVYVQPADALVHAATAMRDRRASRRAGRVVSNAWAGGPLSWAGRRRGPRVCCLRIYRADRDRVVVGGLGY